MWRQEQSRTEPLLDDRDRPVRLLAVDLDQHVAGDGTLVLGDQHFALCAFRHVVSFGIGTDTHRMVRGKPVLSPG